jgi:hypothetical protein
VHKREKRNNERENKKTKKKELKECYFTVWDTLRKGKCTSILLMYP